MVRKPDRYSFKIASLLKQISAAGGKQMHLEPIQFHKYDLQKKLCVVETQDYYLQRTSIFRKSNQLLLCYVKPQALLQKTQYHDG